MVDINSDKELFIAHTQERMKNLVGKSGNRAHDLQICTPMLYRLSYLDNLMVHERMDHQVVDIAKSAEHRSTNLKVVSSIPTLANKILHSFLGVCDEQFFINM